MACDNMECRDKELEDEKTGIFLRLMTEDDTDYIVRWRNQESVRKNFVYQEDFTRESHLAWVEGMVKTGKVVQFMICETESGLPVGSAYVRDIDRKHRKGEYGMFIGEASARGKGYGTAAQRLTTNYCFSRLGLHKVYSRMYADNMSSIRSCEKNGYMREGYSKDAVFTNGKFRDMVWMAILNPADGEQTA